MNNKSLLRRKKRHKTTKKKRQLNTFTVMSFNIEVLNQLYTNDTRPRNIINDKMLAFINVISDSNVDVVCLQEVAAKNGQVAGSVVVLQDKDTPLTINNKQFYGACLANPLTWESLLTIYRPSSSDSHVYLANAIYATKPPNSPSVSNTMLSGAEHRCFVNGYVNINTQFGVHIASIHLPGGRFDDVIVMKDIVQNGTNSDLAKIKYTYLQTILNSNPRPDIICGDVNTRWINRNDYATATSQESENAYYASCLEVALKQLNKTREDIDESIILPIWIQYMYGRGEDASTSFGIDDFMEKNGYAFNPPLNELHTSRYGGIVERIYYKQNKFICHNTTIVKIAGDTKIMDDSIGLPYEPIISDHFPIQCTFTEKKGI